MIRSAPGKIASPPRQNARQRCFVASSQASTKAATPSQYGDLLSEEFKVQDGLLFDSVRYGDRVEVTVENIAGARTIVGLAKE